MRRHFPATRLYQTEKVELAIYAFVCVGMFFKTEHLSYFLVKLVESLSDQDQASRVMSFLLHLFISYLKIIITKGENK